METNIKPLEGRDQDFGFTWVFQFPALIPAFIQVLYVAAVAVVVHMIIFLCAPT